MSVRHRRVAELDERLAPGKQVADAVLYEGYVLYPYRASARKNQMRWQFGVLAPEPFVAGSSGGSGGSRSSGEVSSMQTEMILEAGAQPRLHLRLRALQVQTRTVERLEANGAFVRVESLDTPAQLWTSFDEAVEHRCDVVDVAIDELTGPVQPIGELRCAAVVETEPIPDGLGRIVRQRWPVSAQLSAAAVRDEGPYPLVKLTVRIDNVTDWIGPAETRDDVVRRSLVAVHLFMAIDGGRFVSMLDPPEFARPAVASCTNVGTFPVLISDDVVLSSPIILYDHPAVAPESEGDMFDATEIDEILALRVLTLTDEEKREARGTDPRSAAIVDRCDQMGPDAFGALHGTFRSLRPPSDDHVRPWWEPAVDADFDPWTDTVAVGANSVGKGTRVTLRPSRRADAQDLFVAGRTATVAGIFHDVDDSVHVAVVLDDDPAADLHQWQGRYLYFHPDEIEVCEGRAVKAWDELLVEAVPGDSQLPAPEVLVAGIGNIFLGDDGFGVEAVRHLLADRPSPLVKVGDFGIRGVHLAYELLYGYRMLILIDAVAGDDPPGTVSQIEVPAGGDDPTTVPMDAHRMDPAAVLAMTADLGGAVGRVVVVGCQPASVDEGIGLSDAVAAAVPTAVDLVRQLIASATGASAKEAS